MSRDSLKKDVESKDTVVDLLRKKSEEEDIDNYLKSSFGGYTKKSVKEYLSVLKKNQQKVTDTFNKNQQDLYEEKEKLKSANETLQSRLSKVQMEYKNLSDSILMNKLDNSDYTLQDVLSLKGSITALEEELKKSSNEKITLNSKLQQLGNSNDTLSKKIEQLKQEIQAQREMYLAEKQQGKNLRDNLTELSANLEAAKDEAKYWKSLQAEGQKAELQFKVNELTEELTAQKETLSKQRSEAELQQQAIASLKERNALLEKEMEELKNKAEALKLERDKLSLVQDNLREKLQQELEKSITLINERSGITIDKLLLEKKLQETEVKLSKAELELNTKNRLLNSVPRG